MSTKITADNGATIEVGQLGITVVHPEGITSIWARLSDAQRVELAAALDPGRRGLHVRLDNQAKTLATFQRERDEALDWAKRAEDARDTAATRAEQLEREVSKVEGRASEWSIKAQQWRERAEAAEARTAPAVTRADVVDAVNGSRRAGREPDDQGFVPIHPGEAIDHLCALFGIEAEQAVDPVEEKARELYRAATPDARWETVADEYRRIARHVLGQEADQ